MFHTRKSWIWGQYNCTWSHHYSTHKQERTMIYRIFVLLRLNCVWICFQKCWTSMKSNLPCLITSILKSFCCSFQMKHDSWRSVMSFWRIVWWGIWFYHCKIGIYCFRFEYVLFPVKALSKKQRVMHHRTMKPLGLKCDLLNRSFDWP